MHELSVAQSIVEIVEQHVAHEDRHAVRNVKVKIGEMAGVIPDSLEFCYSAIIANTALQDSKLVIEFVPYTLECKTCGKVFRSSLGIAQCPKCEGFDTLVGGGTELNVAEIELADGAERQTEVM